MLLNTYYTILEWLEKLMLPCIFKTIFNRDCPGCGLQRSLFLLLRGRLNESIEMYWATLPILAMFLFCYLHLKFRFRWGNTILIILYCFTGILIFCQYFYKLSTHS
jgi:hypothetical protein